MTNEEMARSSLLRSRDILEEAEFLYKRGSWNLVVRRSQETIELALKATLRRVGLEVPKLHDVGPFLKEHREYFSGRMLEGLDRLASISRRWKEERVTCFYGDEETGTPPEKLYSQFDADQALGDARLVLEVCTEFIEKR